jgi:hypothetical protein
VFLSRAARADASADKSASRASFGFRSRVATAAASAAAANAPHCVFTTGSISRACTSRLPCTSATARLCTTARRVVSFTPSAESSEAQNAGAVAELLGAAETLGASFVARADECSEVGRRHSQSDNVGVGVL